MKRVSLAVAGVLAALMTAMTGGAAAGGTSATIGSVHIGGLVAPQVGGKIVANFRGPRPGVSRAMRTPYPASSDNLQYNGGRIMVDPTYVPIYWNGGGTSTYPARYQTIINRFFTDISAATGRTTNVFAAATQYNDPFDGPITGGQTVGAPITDTDPYPADSAVSYGTPGGDYPVGVPSSTACGDYNPYPQDVAGLNYCFTDAELEQEIHDFLVANPSLQDPTSNTEYVFYTGKNVGSCFPDMANPYGQDCAYTEYCAYHGSFWDDTLGQDVVYANMPYPNQGGTYYGSPYNTACAGKMQFPNAGGATATDPLRWDKRAADQAINVSSHEMNESLTDPDLNAWWDSNPSSPFYGYENGDLCAWYFPGRSIIGGSAAQLKQYNQVINGDHYFVQGEWSNFSANAAGNSGCVWNFAGPPMVTNTDGATNDPWIQSDGAPVVGSTVLGQVGGWSNHPTSYVWSVLRCNPEANNDCKVAATGTATPTQAAAGIAYKVGTLDDKMTLEFSVIAKNAVGSGPLDISDATSQVVGEPEGGSPSISVSGAQTPGSAISGSLTGDVDAVLSNVLHDDWGFLPKAYAYQWLRCDSQGNNCSVVAKGTLNQPTLTGTTAAPLLTPPLVPSWSGSATYELSVVASNANGKSDTVVTDPVSQNYAVGAPSISDVTGSTFASGDKLAADPDGTDWNPSPTGFAFKWYTCTSTDTSTCTTAITGATSQSYVLQNADTCAGYVAAKVTPLFSQQASSTSVWTEVEATTISGSCT